MWKESKTLKRWRRRWGVLTTSSLSFFKQPGDEQATESLRAGEVLSVTLCTEKDGQHSKEVRLVIREAGGADPRDMYLAFDDDASKSAWAVDIEQNLSEGSMLFS